MSEYTIICGDCQHEMAGLQPVDHVITDPPYEREAHTQGRRTTMTLPGGIRVKAFPKPLDFDAITPELRDDVSAHMARLSLGWILAFCQAEAVADWRDSLALAGARWRRSCVWVKPNGQPQLSGDRPGMGYESIACAWAGEGRSSWNGGGKLGVFTHNAIANFQQEDRVHMAQKPLALMLELVNLFTLPGQTILDPFMGSGTTGVAAVMLGRRFIGIEQRPEDCETARERMAAASAQGQLFSSDATPEQLEI